MEIAAHNPLTILIRFGHGLGDHVQLTTLLAHLKKYRPDWTIDLQVFHGAETIYDGLARNVYLLDQKVDKEGYDWVRDFAWPEPTESYRDSPSTNAAKCLRDLFGIMPDPELCRYHIALNAEVRERAWEYLTNLSGPQVPKRLGENGRLPIVFLHYKAHAYSGAKDIDEHVIREAVTRIIELDCLPIIIDFFKFPSAIITTEGRTDIVCLRREDPIWGGKLVGDAQLLAAMIDQCALFVGIDSGPGHVAGATTCPTLIVRQLQRDRRLLDLHPLHYYEPAKNVLHLLCGPMDAGIQPPVETGLAYFREHYQYEMLKSIDALPDVISRRVSA